MKDGTNWNVYLLDGREVNKLRESNILLRTMKPEDIIKLKILGPISLVANNHYKAKRAFFQGLKNNPEFKEHFSKMPFRDVLPYIYTRNEVDERRHEKPTTDAFFQMIEDCEAKLVKGEIQ